MRAPTRMITPSAEDILNQMPGLIYCMDSARTILFSNQEGAKTLGFINQAQSEGILIDNIPCKASEFAEMFGAQNTLAIETNTELKYLDIHPFANDQILTILMVKSPIIYKESHKAVIGHGTILSRSLLLNISMAIASSDKRFRPYGNVNQRSYQLGSQFNDTKLSKRELECLFYVVRGKTYLEISKILKLSKRTIEFYIENLKNKLNCATKSDLIEKAIENQFINFIPESLLENAKKQTSILLPFD